ncbi:MAG: tmoC [Chloroflexi bacterium]|nr:tmoC [Chloroflexota bacterium]MEA2619053.1 toluene monooxygenase system ferredoxin subunit [Chloroflexota bacterium]
MTAQRALAWVPVTTLDELWEGEMTRVVVDGVPVLLVNLDGEVLAYDDRCPHAGNSLVMGRLEDGTLTCAAHEWVFDPRTGRGINPTATCLESVDVCVDGEVVLVDVGGRR